MEKEKISQKNRRCDALRQEEERLLRDVVAEGRIIGEFSKSDKKKSVKCLGFTDFFCREHHSRKSSSEPPVSVSLAGRGGTRFSGSYRKDVQWEPADMTPFLGQTTCPGASSRPRVQ